jgi:outer membrane lipoprotein-sorting protein
MNRNAIRRAAAWTAAALIAASANAQSPTPPDPAAALRAADQAMYPPSFSMAVAITTRKADGTRTEMSLTIAHKADVGSFMELTAPARSKGTRFLQTADALWMYSPKAGSRTALRLSPRDSFQGSVFSNNDISDSTWANDYAPSLAGDAVLDTADFGPTPVWIIAGAALRRDVPYGAIRLYLRKADLLPLRVEYDAKSGLAVKTLDLADFAPVAGRLRPRRLVMAAADGSGERSEVILSDLRERTDLGDAMFSQAWLVR